MTDRSTVWSRDHHARRKHPHVRIGVWATLLVSGILLAVIAELMFSGTRVPALGDVIRVLKGETVRGLTFQILDDRLPKSTVAILAGGALGVSGSLFQTLLRNPLASPDVIGVTGSASAAAIAGTILWGAQGFAVTASAIVGAVLISAVVMLLAGKGDRAGGRLIVGGIAIAAAAAALTDHLVSRADLNTAADALRWLSGSLTASTWERVTILALCLVVLLPCTVVGVRALRLLELGDDLATALGSRVRLTRMFVVVVGACLAAVATAVTGPLVFVAFIGGVVGRGLAGGRPSPLLAALCGALLVQIAELVGTLAFGDVDLPAGVVTGMIGAPVLLALLIRSGRTSR